MSEFTDYLSDVFARFGPVQAKKMFGGYGLYHDDCMFGLVADDTLFLKVDQENLAFFTDLDLAAFEYEKKDGKTMAMSFYLAPESIYEDEDEAALWATRSYEAAFRARAKSRSKQTAKKKSASKKKTAGKRASKKKRATKTYKD